MNPKFTRCMFAALASHSRICYHAVGFYLRYIGVYCGEIGLKVGISHYPGRGFNMDISVCYTCFQPDPLCKKTETLDTT